MLDVDGSLWIAKFPSRDDGHDVGAWEGVLHRIARRAGIVTAEARVERFGHRHHTFLAKRTPLTAAWSGPPSAPPAGANFARCISAARGAPLFARTLVFRGNGRTVLRIENPRVGGSTPSLGTENAVLPAFGLSAAGAMGAMNAGERPEGDALLMQSGASLRASESRSPSMVCLRRRGRPSAWTCA